MKAQSSFEYLLVTGFMISAVIGIAAAYFYFYQQTNEDVHMGMIDNNVKKIMSDVRDVYQSPGSAKRSIRVKWPGIVTDIYVENRKYLVVETDSEHGEQVYKSEYPISSSIDLDQNIGNDLVIEKFDDVIAICAISCRCTDNETCGNSIDDDCDGLTDDCDNECGTDSDLDGATQECGDTAGDCDLDPDRSPLEDEICGNAVDENCDGQTC